MLRRHTVWKSGWSSACLGPIASAQQVPQAVVLGLEPSHGCLPVDGAAQPHVGTGAASISQCQWPPPSTSPVTCFPGVLHGHWEATGLFVWYALPCVQPSNCLLTACTIGWVPWVLASEHSHVFSEMSASCFQQQVFAPPCGSDDLEELLDFWT